MLRLRARRECGDELQLAAREMMAILHAPEANEDELAMALHTLAQIFVPQEAAFSERRARIMQEDGVTRTRLARRTDLGQPAMQQLIRRRWGIALSIRTVGRRLKRRGFTPQKPARRALEQDAAAAPRWLIHRC